MADAELEKKGSDMSLVNLVDHVPILRKCKDTIMSRITDDKQPTKKCVCCARQVGENIWEVLRSRDCRYHMSFDVYVPNENDTGIVYMKIIEAAEKITQEYWDKALVANAVMTKVPNE